MLNVLMAHLPNAFLIDGAYVWVFGDGQVMPGYVALGLSLYMLASGAEGSPQQLGWGLNCRCEVHPGRKVSF